LPIFGLGNRPFFAGGISHNDDVCLVAPCYSVRNYCLNPEDKMKSTFVTNIEQTTRPRDWRRMGLWIGGIIGGLLLLLAIAWGIMMTRMGSVPANLDYATTRLTDNGLYRVTYVTPDAAPPINQLHAWTLRVETADGRPVEDATITVDGDMPQHGHGLPTRPQVTQYLGDGEYLVEGMRFQMGGWWIVEFDITAAGQTDHVTFNLMLQR
jgi:hypothetical protein